MTAKATVTSTATAVNPINCADALWSLVVSSWRRLADVCSLSLSSSTIFSAVISMDDCLTCSQKHLEVLGEGLEAAEVVVSCILDWEVFCAVGVGVAVDVARSDFVEADVSLYVQSANEQKTKSALSLIWRTSSKSLQATQVCTKWHSHRPQLFIGRKLNSKISMRVKNAELL